jgi:hypothetical protein
MLYSMLDQCSWPFKEPLAVPRQALPSWASGPRHAAPNLLIKEGHMQELSVRRAEPPDGATISALLFEFNGEALSSEVLAQRMAAARGLETVFLAKRFTSG